MNARLVDGVWVAENEAVTNMWVARLAPESQEITKRIIGEK
jgi:hypothetical protein